MTNREAFDIVLKLAKANTLAEHDIMYAQQEAQASLERQAIEIVEDYRNDLMEDDLIITQGDKKLKEMLED